MSRGFRHPETGPNPGFRHRDLLLYPDRTPFALAQLSPVVWGDRLPRRKGEGDPLTKAECGVLARLPDVYDLGVDPPAWWELREIKTKAHQTALWSLMRRGYLKMYRVPPELDPEGQGGLVLYKFMTGDNCPVVPGTPQLQLLESPEPEFFQAALFNPRSRRLNRREQLSLIGAPTAAPEKAKYERERTLFEEFGARGAPVKGEKGYRGPPHEALVQKGREDASAWLDQMIASWTDEVVGLALACAARYFEEFTDLYVEADEAWCESEAWNEESYFYLGTPAHVIVDFTPGRGWGGERWLQSSPGDEAYEEAESRVKAGLAALELAIGVNEGRVATEFAVEVLYEAYYKPEVSGRLKLVPITLKEAEAFIVEHHSALPCMPQNTAYAVGSEYQGRLVAVATAGSPTGRWGARRLDPKNILELTRIASDATGPKGTSSMLAARMIKLAPKTRRGDPEGPWLFVTYSLLSEAGTTYRALRELGLRPVEMTKGKGRGGSRRGTGGCQGALAELDKVRWEAGPVALPPQWSVLERGEQARLLNRGAPPEIKVTGARSARRAFDHAKVKRLYEKALKTRPKHPVAVLLPCAQTKPYRSSPSHAHGYLPAVKGLAVDLVAVSEPLGAFPYAWSDTGIAASYDFPPSLLKGDARAELVRRIRRWMEKVGSKYNALVLALPGHHRQLVREAAEGLNLKLVDGSIQACHASVCPAAHARPTSQAYRKWLRGVIQAAVKRYGR